MGCADAVASEYQGSTIDGIPLYYNASRYTSEDLGSRSGISCDAGFKTRLDGWLDDFNYHHPYGEPIRISYLGSYVNRNDGCVSNHNYGTAFDLSRLEWSNGKRWWVDNYPNDKKFATGVEAMSHKHFKDSLGYLYDSQHENHIHMDDSQSVEFYGDVYGSDSQNKFVSAALRDVYDYDQDINDYWTGQMSARTDAIMTSVYGSGHNITQTPEDWKNFLGYTCGLST